MLVDSFFISNQRVDKKNVLLINEMNFVGIVIAVVYCFDRR